MRTPSRGKKVQRVPKERSGKERRPSLGISKSAVLRIAHRAGVKRVEKDMITYTRNLIYKYVENWTRVAILHAEHANRRVIQQKDMIRAGRFVGVRFLGTV